MDKDRRRGHRPGVDKTMRYAWIVTANSTYLPSLQAMLNAIEYYEYQCVDVHIIHDEDIADYVKSIENDYTFDIIPVPLAEVSKPGHSKPHDYVYSKYKHAWDIQHVYKAIFHIDCDCLILANFEKYFEVAEQGRIIPCAQFPHTSLVIEDYKRLPQDQVDINTPLANFPIFYNPKYHAGVMKWIWDNQPNELNSDGARNNEMYFFNKALFEHGRMDDILVLPGNLWVTDCCWANSSIKPFEYAGKKGIINATFDRVQIMHNKFWKEGVGEGEIERNAGNGPAVEILKGNIKVILDMYRFFNYKTEKPRKDHHV